MADAAEVGAAELHQRFALEGIELEIDFEIFFVFGQTLDEIFVFGDADAVRIHHQMADGAGLGHFHNLEKIWMDRGLAAGELDNVGMAFVADDCVEHFFDLIEGAELLALGAAGGVADGAAQVAVVADLDEREAGVLLVVGAEAAVVGASPFDGSVVDHGASPEA